MKILEFVSSLLPKLAKDKVEENINICKNELQNTVIPSYGAAADHIKSFKSKELQSFEKQWYSKVREAKKGPFVASVHERLKATLDTLGVLDRIVKTNFEDEVVVAGITVFKANVIKMVEVCDFISIYAMKFLNYIYILELAEIDPTKAAASKLSQGEITKLKNHFLEFCIAVNAMTKDTPKTEKLLKDIPDVLVNASGKEALQVFGALQTDPMGAFNVKGFVNTPIFHFGIMVAESQAKRYKRNKELKSILELRLLELQQTTANVDTPELSREIEIIQSRIDALDSAIRKEEESVR